MKKIAILLLLPMLLQCREFRVASYNVENLFDLKKSGTEYTEYIPFTGYGWNEKMFSLKLKNISRVICDLKPDILALQEIESDDALRSLQKAAALCGSDFPYRAIADDKESTVKTALLSRFPILSKREIDPDGTLGTRNILEVTLSVDGRRLTLFVNHWKSRSGPESRRVVSAEALMKRLRNFRGDYVLLGDFNSNWDERRVIRSSKRLNDTGGVTGIGDILKTWRGKKSVDKYTLSHGYHYDLWLELPPRRRWSHNFFGRKGSLDHIILPPAMFDDKGVNYVDRSFRRFTPSYLFRSNGAIYRWKLAKKGHGRHLGEGYSDHLPIYAEFTTDPFRFAKKREPKERIKGRDGKLSPTEVSVADLYGAVPGPCRFVVPEAVVIYKKGPIAILKEPGGRAITVYKDVQSLEFGRKYRVEIRRIYRYRGLQEVTELKVLKDLGRTDTAPMLLFNPENIEVPADIGEVIAEIEGLYKRGYLYYGSGRKIKLYFKDRSKRPKSGEKVVLRNVRVSIYKNRAELVID
ncbi:hypothetical protein NNO_1073 [Hydrogenimonas sp.]|nr:hypothetical protein NNO_1073 [Hydrogenimonas sp.]